MYFRSAPSAKNESLIIYSGIIIIHVDNIIKDNTTQF